MSMDRERENYARETEAACPVERLGREYKATRAIFDEIDSKHVAKKGDGDDRGEADRELTTLHDYSAFLIEAAEFHQATSPLGAIFHVLCASWAIAEVNDRLTFGGSTDGAKAEQADLDRAVLRLDRNLRCVVDFIARTHGVDPERVGRSFLLANWTDPVRRGKEIVDARMGAAK